MSESGELAAAFRALAQDAAQAGEDVGSSVGRWFEETARIEEENVSATLAADADAARALNAIRPDTGDIADSGAAAGGLAGAGAAGSGEPGPIARMLSGADGAGGAGLTSEDRAAIHDYTTNDGYQTMNPFLRDPSGYSEAEKAAISERADRVSAGLAKLPPRPGTTYRGVDFSPDLVKNYQEGAIVTERAFTSTSTDPAVATGAFSGNTLMTITGHSGRDIAPFSDYPESEILYDKGTRFQVIRNAFDPVIGKTVIQLKEIG
jgi:hypothetical protein